MHASEYCRKLQKVFFKAWELEDCLKDAGLDASEATRIADQAANALNDIAENIESQREGCDVRETDPGALLDRG